MTFVNMVLAECAPAGFKAVTFFASVDRVSTDRTRELLDMLKKQQPQLKIVCSPENRTVVDAYVRGYQEALSAGCDWILEIDAGSATNRRKSRGFWTRCWRGTTASLVAGFARVEGCRTTP